MDKSCLMLIVGECIGDVVVIVLGFMWGLCCIFGCKSMLGIVGVVYGFVIWLYGYRFLLVLEKLVGWFCVGVIRLCEFIVGEWWL